MKNYSIILILLIFSLNVFAQPEKNTKVVSQPAAKVKDDDTAALDLAKLSVTALGGENFKKIKTLDVRGTVDVTASSFPQAIPATFATIFSGEKYRLEITNPFQPLKQIYDGEQTSSSIKGFNLPPINRLGFALLQRIDEKEFTVSALPEKLKKKKGFRITSPEGYYTDFFVEEKTSQVKGYESSYVMNDRDVTTSVEIDKFRTVENVLIPEKYSQRFDLGQLTVYGNFKAKEILVNSEIPDSLFQIK